MKGLCLGHFQKLSITKVWSIDWKGQSLRRQGNEEILDQSEGDTGTLNMSAALRSGSENGKEEVNVTEFVIDLLALNN